MTMTYEGHLNSVLIEGIIKEMIFNSEGNGVYLQIESIKVYREKKNSADVKKVIQQFTVEASGKIAENCQKIAEKGKAKGRVCRVVGRLESETKKNQPPRVYISAEHIEFRPMEKKV